MQLAKMRYLSYEQSFSRKFQQVLLALYLELCSSKEEIVRAYLNEMDFGLDEKGIEFAAEHFFQTSPAALTQRQAIDLILRIPDPRAFDEPFQWQGEVKKKAERLYLSNARFRGFLQDDIKQIKSAS